MSITAADVKKLRDLTGAGMMDAKKALTETDGDFDQAIELLRVKGLAKAKSRGEERETSAGLVANAGGALVELKSETDFVAKNEEFVATAQQIAEAADSAQAADAEALKGVTLGDSTVGAVPPIRNGVGTPLMRTMPPTGDGGMPCEMKTCMSGDPGMLVPVWKSSW